jgi:hypothetical protein
LATLLTQDHILLDIPTAHSESSPKCFISTLGVMRLLKMSILRMDVHAEMDSVTKVYGILDKYPISPYEHEIQDFRLTPYNVHRIYDTKLFIAA